MTNVGSIEAVLSLNSTGFTEGLSTATTALNKFSNATTKLTNSKPSQAMRNLNDAITQLESSLQLLDGVNRKNLSTFSRMANAVNNMAKGLRILQSDELDVVQGINTMNNIFKAFQGTLNGAEVKIKGVATVIKEMASSEKQSSMSFEQANSIITRNSQVMQQNAVAKLRAMGYSGQLSAEEKMLASSEQQVASATDRATNSMNRQASASKGLGKAMSSLRMMGTMVGSMIAYNFVHNLAMATTETINAKSEMNGYFQMLGYTRGQVADFNAELDKTVQLFPRLNKYALGETISSIGVEFELSTEEMKKAMPVVSMITSEYLRAGRNVNEASLAVKDILQGEFQRLSRETGVKSEQLMEAGWSGDKNDVMGLLEALDKVGKSRNWDTFVTKANSLNDAVLILQNRFSEWSADMVERVQPSIVHAFNTIMSVASTFGSMLNGVIDWLTGDKIGQAVGWTLLATHIASVVGALIHLRTGANLTQIAQMGLTRSIGATVLGLEAETVAEYGTRTAITSRITGIEAEKVAETGRLNSILAVVTGLEAEEVAEIGKTKALLGSLLGLDMATLKEYGFATALAQATTQMEAQKLASMSLVQKIALIGATTIPATAVVLAFAVAFGKLALDTMEATNRMSNFYDIQKNGEQYVNDAKDSVNNLKNKIKELKDTQSKYTKGSQEYENVGKAIDSLNDKVELANQNVKDNYEAWQRVNSAQENYDTTKQELQLGLQQKINKALVDTGLSEKEANELSNTYLNEAIDGSRQLYQALQSVSLQYSKQAGGVAKLTEYWENKGLTPEEIKLKVDPYIDSQNAIADDIEKMKLSTDLVEVASTWGKLQIDQIQLTLKENLPKIEAGDWKGGLTGMMKGLAHGVADLPIFGDFWDWVFKQAKIKETYGGKGWAGLDQFLNDANNNLRKLIIDSVTGLFDPKNLEGDGFKLPFQDLFEWMANGVADSLFDFTNSIKDKWDNLLSFEWLNLDGDGGTGNGMKRIDILGLVKNLFNLGDSIDFSWATEFINTNIITPISTAWSEFMANPLGFLNVGGFDIGHLISILFGGGGNSEDPNAIDPVATWVNNNIINPMSTAITNGIINIPIIGSIAQMLGLVPSENQNAYQTGYNLIDNLKRGVEDKIRDIPIIGDIAQMLGLIPSQNDNAHGKGYGIGDNIKRGEAEGHKGIADNVRDEMGNVITAISNKFGEAYAAAHDIGSRILNGIKDALDMHSPSIISRELIANEFGVYIPQAISDAGSVAYNTAMEYGQNIKDGISATSFNTVGFDSAVGEYQADAQMVADSSYLMGTTTTTAFNDMTLAVNQTTNTMTGNVATSYSDMQTKQQTSLNSMKTQNLQAYQDMYLKSNQSLIQMRDSTSNVTAQMVSAWSHMKNQLVATANQLKSESTSHFNQLSDTIGSFYRKIQNPSNWGAGAGSNGAMVRGARHPSAGKSFARVMTRRASHHGAGSPSPYSRGGTGRIMTLRSLKNLICPTSNCDIFDGYDLSQKVDVDEFLSSIEGEHGFGWGDWSGRHYSYIKDTSDQWSMKSPTINLVGGIPTDANYKVGDFENGTPKISFGAFQSMAESIFTAIPYRFYNDSDWKGSWLGALQAGACNCSDGADALIAFAQVCGFDGYKQHGTWTNSAGQKFGHFWAVINGKKMDTTGWQHGYGWSPSNSGAGGIPVRRATHSPMNVDSSAPSIIININEPVYGVDDLDNKIQESVKQGLREEFNDPWTVAI